MRKYLLIILLFSTFYAAFGQGAPKSADLRETDKFQRRDLSMPMSRVLINFFDFKSTESAYEYSSRSSLAMDIAYLTTEKNEPGTQAITRFSRSVTDLLNIHNTPTGIDGVILNPNLGRATTFATEWMPHALPFSAKYADGASLTGVDFLYDLSTVVRELEFTGQTKNYCFSGNWKGTISFKESTIVVENNNMRYAISFSTPISNYKLSNGKWYLTLDSGKMTKELTISVAFADKGEDVAKLIARAQNPINKKDVDKVLIERERYWDNFLAKVPQPQNFELSSVKTFSVTPQDIKQAYYKAWVFTAQNVLPEDPKAFPYPQICTGKPSLWDEGEEHAPFSAAWESFIGIQLYAYVDPELAWRAFKGLMSLVDQQGMLGGESLPSRKAQTALILYELTGDKESLKEIYPALKRYLDWRLKITHWVYGDMRPSEDYKDAEFAFSALCDIQYLMKISEILGQVQDIKEWSAKFDTLADNSLKWFWETPQSLPIQNYWIGKNRREDRNTIWITTCLHVKDYLKGDYLNSTIKRFDKDYNTDMSFANFFMPKYPDVSYSVYGLIEHGYSQRALGTMEATLRDVARGHAAFAEQYIGDDFRPDGVRPSLFGSSIIIDFVLMANGYMLGDGAPKAVLLPNNGGGVSNILMGGKRYELTTNPKTKKVRFGLQGEQKTISCPKSIVNLKTTSK